MKLMCSSSQMIWLIANCEQKRRTHEAWIKRMIHCSDCGSLEDQGTRGCSSERLRILGGSGNKKMFQRIKMMIQTQRHLGADLQLLGEQPRRGNYRIADPRRIKEQGDVPVGTIALRIQYGSRDKMFQRIKMMIQPAANDDAAMKKKSLHQKDGANTMFIGMMTHGIR